MGQAKLPAFQFYPGDWRKDPGVQALTYEERGIWVEVLCIMHEAGERGCLVWPSGSPMDDGSVARILGLTEAKWKQTRSKLEATGVATEREDGTLINRRMVRDEDIRRKRAEAGRKGGTAKQTPSKHQANTQAKRGSSVSISSSKKNTIVETMWSVYLTELGGDGKQPTLTDKRRGKLQALHDEQLADSNDLGVAFRRILNAVKASEHHMSKREYQLPESLFRNPERRERWALKATDASDGIDHSKACGVWSGDLRMLK